MGPLYMIGCRVMILFLLSDVPTICFSLYRSTLILKTFFQELFFLISFFSLSHHIMLVL